MLKKIILPKKNIFTVINYLKMVSEISISCEEKYGILAEVLISQSALETGWGKYVLSGINPVTGKIECSNNYFNIKAGTGKKWNGDIVLKDVKEYNKNKNYEVIYEKAAFRKYNSIQESFEDYCELISKSKRYEKAYENRNNIDVYLKELVNAGYATDPDYEKKIKKIINNYLLIEFQEKV